MSTDLLQSLSQGIFRATFWVGNAALRMVHKAASPASVYTGHGQRETNTIADWTRIPGTPTGTYIVLGYRTLEQACSPVSPGDATLKEEIHRLTRVTARGLHLPLQAADKRRRQGTQGQRQVGAGLWTEKVDIVYN